MSFQPPPHIPAGTPPRAPAGAPMPGQDGAPSAPHLSAPHPLLPTYGHDDEPPLPWRGRDEVFGLPTGYYLGQDASAPMTRRLAARMVDLLMVLVVTVPLVSLLSGGQAPNSTRDYFVSSFVFGVLAVIYDTLMLVMRGRTVGMGLLKIRVCNEATGHKLNVAASLVRALAVHGFWLVWLGFLSLLVYVSPFLDSSGRRQGWHDKLARDVVIKEESLSEDSTQGPPPSPARPGQVL